MQASATIQEIPTPADLLISSRLPGAHFHDSYTLPYPVGDQSALAIYLRVMQASPAWADGLMRLRNRLVQLVGLKDLGGFADLAGRNPATFNEGQRIGIFSLLRLTPQEVILGDSDRHLDVQVSFAVGQRNNQPALITTTVVHTHNRLGRIYMWLVKPFHRRIVRSLLRRALSEAKGT